MVSAVSGPSGFPGSSGLTVLTGFPAASVLPVGAVLLFGGLGFLIWVWVFWWKIFSDFGVECWPWLTNHGFRGSIRLRGRGRSVQVGLIGEMG